MPESFKIEDPEVFLAVLGILILIVTVMRLGRRRARRRMEESQPRAHTPAPASPVEAKRAAEDLQQILLQIQEVAREIEARLDTRIRFAKRLIAESESKLDELAARLAEANVDDVVPQRATPSAAVAAYKANDIVTIESRSKPPEGTSNPTDATGDTDRVVQLAAGGMSPVSIARELGRPIGEVELMLSLHRQSRSEN